MNKPLFLGVACVCLCACGSPSAVTDTRLVKDTVPEAPMMDLAGYDLPLLLRAPEPQLTGGELPLVRWVEQSGRTEITAGEHFGMGIAEEPADMARLKADLDRDQLVRNTIVREDSTTVVYRSEFPDDPTLVFVHFYQVLHVGGRSFVVQDLDGGRFNEQDVVRMAAALVPKQPV
jgi:hypothetical protein